MAFGYVAEIDGAYENTVRLARDRKRGSPSQIESILMGGDPSLCRAITIRVRDAQGRVSNSIIAGETLDISGIRDREWSQQQACCFEGWQLAHAFSLSLAGISLIFIQQNMNLHEISQNGNPPSGWDLHLTEALNSADNPNIGCYRRSSHCTFCSPSPGTHPLGEVQSRPDLPNFPSNRI